MDCRGAPCSGSQMAKGLAHCWRREAVQEQLSFSRVPAASNPARGPASRSICGGSGSLAGDLTRPQQEQWCGFGPGAATHSPFSPAGVYSKTVNLPQTAFDMRANSVVREPQLQKFWEDNRIYEALARDNPGVRRRGLG
jgi:hypothetical protein